MKVVSSRSWSTSLNRRTWADVAWGQGAEGLELMERVEVALYGRIEKGTDLWQRIEMYVVEIGSNGARLEDAQQWDRDHEVSDPPRYPPR